MNDSNNGEKSPTRSKKEIQAAELKFFQLVWTERQKLIGGNLDVSPVPPTYSEEELGPYAHFEWGMINGKLSALRWVLGCARDSLDT